MRVAGRPPSASPRWWTMWSSRAVRRAHGAKNLGVEALRKDAPAAEHRVAVETPRPHDEPNRLARHRQIRQMPMIAPVYPLRGSPASRARTRLTNRANRNQRAGAVAADIVHHESARYQGRRSERGLHGVDSNPKINATRISNSIKNEADPKLHADPPHNGVNLP